MKRKNNKTTEHTEYTEKCNSLFFVMTQVLKKQIDIAVRAEPVEA
jgi:hypothetical protein